ncbi:MAG: hypothetical protein JNK63_07115 [Chthonomonas sp.]|nr:hypothetical protein [Chthonomonas sp.]
MASPTLFRSLKTGKTIRVQGDAIGQGGEATVYKVRGQPSQVAKVYKEPTSEQAEKLAAMLKTAPRQSLARPAIAWPIDALLDPRNSQVQGMVMPFGIGTVRLFEVTIPKLRKARCPGVSLDFLTCVAANLATVVHQIHSAGHVIGDVNDQNILVRQDASIMVIDCDSFQVRQGTRIYPCMVGRPEYSAPEVLAGRVGRFRDQGQDCFALAVVVFQLLFNGRHPFEGLDAQFHTVEDRMVRGRFPHALVRQPGVEPPRDVRLVRLLSVLIDLFSEAFDAGCQKPDMRPSARRWAKSLLKARPVMARLN